MKRFVLGLILAAGLAGDCLAACPPDAVTRSDRGQHCQTVGQCHERRGLFARRPVRRFLGRVFGRRCC